MVKMQTRATTVTVVLVFFSTISCSNAQQPIREIDFDLDVRPILADRCYACHGPDEHSREADLRLDVRKAAEYAFTNFYKPTASVTVTKAQTVKKTPKKAVKKVIKRK